jgi:hypothetical protein
LRSAGVLANAQNRATSASSSYMIGEESSQHGNLHPTTAAIDDDAIDDD